MSNSLVVIGGGAGFFGATACAEAELSRYFLCPHPNERNESILIHVRMLHHISHLSFCDFLRGYNTTSHIRQFSNLRDMPQEYTKNCAREAIELVV